MLIFGHGEELSREDNWPKITSRKLLEINPTSGNNAAFHPKVDGDDDEYPPKLLYTAASYFMVMAILGMAGNTLAYFALTKDSKLKHFASTIFVNLAAVDLFISCVYPLMASILFINDKGHYVDENCNVFAFIQYAGSMISMFLITALAFNRFIFLVYPRKYLSMFTNKNIFLMIVFIWIFSLILFSFPLAGMGGEFKYNKTTGFCELISNNNNLKKFSLFLIFILSPVAIVSFYLAIFARKKGCTCLKDSSSLQKNEIDFSETKENEVKLNAARDDEVKLNAAQDPDHEGNDCRLLKFILLIFIVTIVCHAPIFYVKTVRKQQDFYIKHVICSALYFTASAIKPGIYYTMNKTYRKKYKSMFIRKRRFQNVSLSLTDVSP